ncbi:MAG: hypothetical protein PHU24_10455 [Sphaerochaetaceae bacterium]|nr:hypothetical protein [Sphaerochaetaceae bacterium]MDD4763742.1 hypothetical protein [Sphaerochaetaceae bacterium]
MPLLGRNAGATGEPGEEQSRGNQTGDVSGISNIEGEDSRERESPTEIQRQRQAANEKEQRIINVPDTTPAEHILVRMGRVFQDTGIQIPIPGPRCVDSQQVAQHATQEMEEAEKISAGADTLRSQTRGSTTSMGTHEQMAVSHEKGSTICIEQ